MTDEKPFVGVLGRIKDRKVFGYAFVLDEPPVTVELFVNDRLVGSVEADRPRPDLRSRGVHPTGVCGYEIAVPEEIALAPGDRFEVRIPGRSGGEWVRNPSILVGADPASWLLEAAQPNRVVAAIASVPEQDLIPEFGVIPLRTNREVLRDTLRALTLREIRNRFGTYRFGYFWAVAQPLLLILALQGAHFLLSAGGAGHIHNVDGIYFFQLGVVPWFMFANGYHSAIGSMKSYRGMYTYRQVQPIDVILVRSFLEFALLTIAFVILAVVLHWSGRTISVADPAAFVAMIVTLLVFTTSVGMIVDVFVTRNDEIRPFIGLADRVLMFISGVFFTLEAMPRELHPWLLWNPLLHAFELGRAAMLEDYTTPCSWRYLLTCTVVAMTLALTLYRRNLHRLTS